MLKISISTFQFVNQLKMHLHAPSSISSLVGYLSVSCLWKLNFFFFSSLLYSFRQPSRARLAFQYFGLYAPIIRSNDHSRENLSSTHWKDTFMITPDCADLQLQHIFACIHIAQDAKRYGWTFFSP